MTQEVIVSSAKGEDMNGEAFSDLSETITVGRHTATVTGLAGWRHADGEIDFDGASGDSTKPSKAALRLNDLLETITERYRDLSSYSQRISFLI